MGAIDHDLLKRLLTRCEEVAVEAGMKSSVATVYDNVLKAPALAYLDAYAGVKAAENTYQEKLEASNVALDSFEPQFREARSVVAAFLPTLTLPATLKDQPTDTDQLNAIEDLNKELAKHSGKPWADQLMNGEYGAKAKVMVEALKELISANKARAKAREVRAAAFDPAYEPYVRFKRVVRDSLGETSKQYKRIHAPRRRTAEEREAHKKAKEAAAKEAAAKEAAAKEAAAKDAAQPAPAKPTDTAAPTPVTPADPTPTPVTPADPTPNP